MGVREPGKIAVAGGTGLVGANLTLTLREKGMDFVSSRFRSTDNMLTPLTEPRDLRRFSECLAFTSGADSLVLCAAISSGLQMSRENPTSSILANVAMTTGLLEAAAQNGIETVIMLSSTTVYPAASYPLAEYQFSLDDPPYEEYFGVGWTNRYFEKLAEFYAMTYGMRVVVFRPTSVFGPFDKFDESGSHVLPSLIRRALGGQDPFVVWGSPEVVRDFIFVEDLVEEILAAILNEDIPSHDPINICSGQHVTIAEAVRAVLDVCDHRPEINFDRDKPTAIPYRAVDGAKSEKLFGKKQRTPLKEGLKKTVEWYKHSWRTAG